MAQSVHGGACPLGWHTQPASVLPAARLVMGRPPACEQQNPYRPLPGCNPEDTFDGEGERHLERFLCHCAGPEYMYLTMVGVT